MPADGSVSRRQLQRLALADRIGFRAKFQPCRRGDDLDCTGGLLSIECRHRHLGRARAPRGDLTGSGGGGPLERTDSLVFYGKGIYAGLGFSRFRSRVQDDGLSDAHANVRLIKGDTFRGVKDEKFAARRLLIERAGRDVRGSIGQRGNFPGRRVDLGHRRRAGREGDGPRRNRWATGRIFAYTARRLPGNWTNP